MAWSGTTVPRADLPELEEFKIVTSVLSSEISPAIGATSIFDLTRAALTEDGEALLSGRNIRAEEGIERRTKQIMRATECIWDFAARTPPREQGKLVELVDALQRLKIPVEGDGKGSLNKAQTVALEDRTEGNPQSGWEDMIQFHETTRDNLFFLSASKDNDLNEYTFDTHSNAITYTPSPSNPSSENHSLRYGPHGRTRFTNQSAFLAQLISLPTTHLTISTPFRFSNPFTHIFDDSPTWPFEQPPPEPEAETEDGGYATEDVASAKAVLHAGTYFYIFAAERLWEWAQVRLDAWVDPQVPNDDDTVAHSPELFRSRLSAIRDVESFPGFQDQATQSLVSSAVEKGEEAMKTRLSESVIQRWNALVEADKKLAEESGDWLSWPPRGTRMKRNRKVRVSKEEEDEEDDDDEFGCPGVVFVD